MAHHNTILSQVLRLVPRHDFENAVSLHRPARRARSFSAWAHFATLVFAQLWGRESLRDIESSLRAQGAKLYHVGMKPVSRTTLADANASRPAALFRSVFQMLLHQCQSTPRVHGFRFKNSLFSLDATTINLCLDLFPWAKYKETKGAIKIHTVLDHAGSLPTVLNVTDGKKADITAARHFRFPRGSFVVFDRGYFDFDFLHRILSAGAYFVTRLKREVRYRVIASNKVDRKSGVTSDQIVEILGVGWARFPEVLRRVGYRDPETGKHYVYLTSCFHLSAKTIAAIYKARWEVELFFKWIKQHLKIRTFLGTSRNAVLAQIWAAACAYLLLAYLRLVSRSTFSLLEIFRRVEANLFERRGLFQLFDPDADRFRTTTPLPQLELLAC